MYRVGDRLICIKNALYYNIGDVIIIEKVRSVSYDIKCNNSNISLIFNSTLEEHFETFQERRKRIIKSYIFDNELY